MAEIGFSKEEKTLIVDKLCNYFDQELNQKLGQFDADFLLDFITNEIGPYFYNRGLYDAQAVMQGRVDLIIESIYEIEKPIQQIVK
jgi:uncharacterized protein (DUF2164 family)